MSAPAAAPRGRRAAPPAAAAAPAPVGLRLAAVALVAAIVGVVVGGGAAYFLLRHFESSSPGQVVINRTTPGGSNSVSLPALLAKLSPSLVAVISQPPSGAPVTSADVGSGFVASSQGLVVTSEGAVAGAAGVEVALASGQLLPATIAAADPDTGVVVLQVSYAGSLPAPLSFATASAVTGDAAIAVSSPVGAGPSADVGTVSSVGLTVTVPDAAAPSQRTVVDGVLRTDTPQPEGSTGAPLVDSAGAVIGILTGDRMQPLDEGASSSASGFALDALAAEQLVESLSATGVGPEPVGLVTRWLDPASGAALGEPTGVQVVAVDSGSAASQAGLQAGDVITSIDGSAAWSQATTAFPCLSDYLLSLGADSVVSLTVVRGGSDHQLSLTLP